MDQLAISDNEKRVEEPSQPATQDAETAAVDPSQTNQDIDLDATAPMRTLDLLPRIKGLFRLLDLINEQGSGGIGN
jgi:hypothetical protein